MVVQTAFPLRLVRTQPNGTFEVLAFAALELGVVVERRSMLVDSVARGTRKVFGERS